MYKTVLSLFLVILVLGKIQAQVGIGLSGTDASAALEVNSTVKGFLPPRMTEVQRDAIKEPGEGLQIFNTTTGQPNYFNGRYWIDLQGHIAEPVFFPEGAIHCDSDHITEVVDVYSPATGKTWMDRNLGASQVAASSSDEAAYGDLYQWGRGADGHQCRDSQTTTTLSSTDQPGHGDFILSQDLPYDWRSSQNDNLWQRGAHSATNPCPSGYRLPTESEWQAEINSWSEAHQNASGAIVSPLKLPVAGYRSNSSGLLGNVGISGDYWSSSVRSTFSRNLYFNDSMFGTSTYNRGMGFSVRCIKD